MTTNENIMQEMLERATSREVVDELAIQMFVLVVQKDAQMISKAREMLIAKIRSHNVAESTRAVAVLEECMTKCGPDFQDEISKFKFLNELIRLVSKKYQGDSTPVAIKQRIMECLLLWTTEFPQKTKIREAYDMLNKEGSVEHGTSTASVAKRESVLGIDEEMLSKLLNSGDPENYKRANLLIQYRVNQDARQTELRLQQKSELQEVQSTVSLLNQMLDAYEAEGRFDVEGSETMNLIRELYISCKKHKPILQRLPELIGNTDQVEENMLADALEALDALLNVMKRYKDVIVHPPSKVSAANTPSQDLLSELLGVQTDAPVVKTTTTTPIEQPMVLSNGQSKQEMKSTKNVNAFDELSEIFGNAENKAVNAAAASNYPDQLLGSLDLLQPVNVFSNNEAEKAMENNSQSAQVSERRAFRELREIDKLSDELFKQQVGERVGSFKKKEPEKLTLNDLVKEKTQVTKPELSSNAATPTKNADTTALSKTSLKNLDDDEILNGEILDTKPIENNKPVEIEKPAEVNDKPALTVKPLSDIVIDLDELTPCGTERILLEDEDVKVTLNFTEDRPSKQVSVIVLAVSNKSKQSMKDFHFEASVKKPCKLRLLPPTDNSLPPFKQYRPPTPINQVLLLLNPTEKEIDVTCIFGYKLGDDPDPIKECVVAKGIPYVE